jgi:hypothetical protein
MADRKKQRPKKYSPEEQKLIEQKWAYLDAELDREMEVLKPSRLRVGHILYEMKLWLQKYGLNRGRRGRWKSVLERHKFDRKTAENWIRLHQEQAGVPPQKWVVAPAKKSQQNSKKNTVKTTVLQCEASITAADEEEKDRSLEGRLPVECVFVLTFAEKQKFMDCVKQLGPLRATQVMYSAVVTATKEADEALGAGA